MQVHYFSEYQFDGMPEFDDVNDDAASYLMRECGSLDLGAIMNIDHREIGLQCSDVRLTALYHGGGEFSATVNVDAASLEKLVKFLQENDGLVGCDEHELDDLRRSLDESAAMYVDELERFTM